MHSVSKNVHYNGATGLLSGRGHINVPPPVAGPVEGRGFWRDGQTPAAFIEEARAIYEKRTGHMPAICYCHASQVDGLAGCGVEVRPARLNERCVILAG